MIYFILKIVFIHERDTERGRDTHRQREKQAPYGEPGAGPNPRTPGSHPEPKADVQPLSHPGVPNAAVSNVKMVPLLWEPV